MRERERIFIPRVNKETYLSKDLYLLAEHLIENGLLDCLEDHPHVSCVCGACEMTVDDSLSQHSQIYRLVK